MQLTDKQQKTLDTIQEYEADEMSQPSMYRLSKILEESPTSTRQVVESLEKKSLVKRDGKHVFAIKKEFCDKQNVMNIPVYGLASCGEALAFAQDNVSGFLQVSASLFRDKDPVQLFAIQAVGDSMNKEGIDDESYIIFEKYCGQDLDKQIVVAIINGMATVKKYSHKSDDLVMLMPSSTNAKHRPIYISKSDNFIIAGILKRILPKK